MRAVCERRNEYRSNKKRGGNNVAEEMPRLAMKNYRKRI